MLLNYIIYYKLKLNMKKTRKSQQNVENNLIKGNNYKKYIFLHITMYILHHHTIK